MQQPIRVTLQHIDVTPDDERSIFDAIHRLERFCDHIVGCEVIVCAGQCGACRVSVKIRTPEREFQVIGRQLPVSRGRLKAALSDAFTQAERELAALAVPLCACIGAARSR